MADRPLLRPGHVARNHIVQEKEFQKLLRDRPWTGPVLVEVTGAPAFWMYHEADDKVSGIYFYYGRDSYESLSCILFGLLAASTRAAVYDIGGHCGVYSLLAASAGSSAVHYFDLMPDIIDRFELNLAISGLEDRVAVNRVGVSSEPGEVEFNYNDLRMTTGASLEFLAYRFSSPVARKGRAAVVTLDDYWTRGGQQPVGLVKMDVERHELSVLRGGGGFFAANRPWVLVEVLSAQQFADLYDAFAGLGYGCAYEVDDNAMELRRVLPGLRLESGAPYSFGIYHNVLFSPGPLDPAILSALASRIAASPIRTEAAA
jgi:FkbM family methyltransferase